MLLSPTLSAVFLRNNGLTADKGYTAAAQPLTWDELFELYSQPGPPIAVEQDGRVVGGGTSLAHSELDICELQKNVFYDPLPVAGTGEKLALLALDYARDGGFKRCYLETTAFLKEAAGQVSAWFRTYTDGPAGPHRSARRLRKRGMLENAVSAQSPLQPRVPGLTGRRALPQILPE